MNSSGLLIRNASQIVTGEGKVLGGRELNQVRVYENASVFIEEGLIRAVGRTPDVEARVQGNPAIVDATGRTVIPGFVDAHTHAVFAGSRVDEFVQKIAGSSYSEIAARGGGILSTVKATRAAGREELKELTRGRLRTALQHGTTTMEIKSGYGLDLANEMKMLEVIAELGVEQPVELVPTFLGAHAVPPDCSGTEYVEKVLAMLPVVASMATSCDVFCDASYFPLPETRRILEEAKKHGLAAQLHAGQFSSDGGVGLGVDLGVRAIAHVDHLADRELAALAASATAALLLPGVSLFGGTPFPSARRMIEAGVIVALATNFNPGSSPSLSMPMMVALACLQMRMSPAEALNAATLNAAYALGRTDVGAIEPGRQADLAILDVSDYRMLPYYFGVNCVGSVIKKGRVAWQR